MRLKIFICAVCAFVILGCEETTLVNEPIIEEEVIEEIEEEIIEPLQAEIFQSALYETYVDNYGRNVVDVTLTDEVTIDTFEYAFISIPAIGIDLVVLGGVDSYDPVNLNTGPTHFEATDMPSTKSSHVVIGGHRTAPNHFFRIDELKPGDLIYLEIEGYRFTYEVLWQVIVDRYDWSIIEENPGYPAISLMTCEPKDDPNAPSRLFVRGRLVD